ncbi:MAG: methyltransferase domain-containing protein [Vicinamibacterales bacterium]
MKTVAYVSSPASDHAAAAGILGTAPAAVADRGSTDQGSSPYGSIVPAGGDTATALNLQRRLRVIARAVSVSGQRILDCGCGAGEYVRALQRLGAEAWGVEFSPEKLASARGDLQDIGIAASSVDVALLNEVLEHVPDDGRALREVHRVLKPGGVLLVFSPNRRYPFETHGSTWRGSTVRVPHYVPLIPYVPLGLSRRVLDFWARNYWPAELRGLVRQAGFTIRDTDYVWQTFEGISHNQPRLIARFGPLLRKTASVLERIPGIRTLGVSQVIIATKGPADGR